MLRGLVLVAAVVAVGAGATWGVSEVRRAWAAERVARGEVERMRGETARMHGDVEQMRGEVVEREAELGREREAKERLERELAAAIESRGKLDGMLEEQAERMAVLAKDRVEMLREGMAPMTEQTRAVVRTLQRCLVEDGHAGLRVLRAQGVGERELLGVEMLERVEMRTVLYLAQRVTVTLDRGKGVVTLRCFGGTVLEDGERRELPEEGLAVELAGVFGEMWEAELSALVRVEGSYPVAEPREPRRVAPAELAIWRERLDVLLAASEQGRNWRVSRLGGVTEHGFADVLLLSYEGKLLTGAVEAAKLRVVVDAATDGVALELKEGVVFHSGGSTPIAAQGWRLALPGVTVGDATERMLGFVQQAAR